jgi:hypothetical protein
VTPTASCATTGTPEFSLAKKIRHRQQPRLARTNVTRRLKSSWAEASHLRQLRLRNPRAGPCLPALQLSYRRPRRRSGGTNLLLCPLRARGWQNAVEGPRLNVAGRVGRTALDAGRARHAGAPYSALMNDVQRNCPLDLGLTSRFRFAAFSLGSNIRGMRPDLRGIPKYRC